MSLYKDPRELRSYFRVEVTPEKPAYLVLEEGGQRVEVSDIGAGGFAIRPVGPAVREFLQQPGLDGASQHRGTLYLDLDDFEHKAPVPLCFKVVASNGTIRCQIVTVDQQGRDRLFTYVHEADLQQRERCNPAYV